MAEPANCTFTKKKDCDLPEIRSNKPVKVHALLSCRLKSRPDLIYFVRTRIPDSIGHLDI